MVSPSDFLLDLEDFLSTPSTVSTLKMFTKGVSRVNAKRCLLYDFELPHSKKQCVSVLSCSCLSNYLCEVEDFLCMDSPRCKIDSVDNYAGNGSANVKRCLLGDFEQSEYDDMCSTLNNVYVLDLDDMQNGIIDDLDSSTDVVNYGSPDNKNEIICLGRTLENIPILDVKKYDHSILEYEAYPSVYTEDLLNLSFIDG